MPSGLSGAPRSMASEPPKTNAKAVAAYLLVSSFILAVAASSWITYRCNRLAVSRVVAAKLATNTATMPIAKLSGSPIAAMKLRAVHGARQHRIVAEPAAYSNLILCSVLTSRTRVTIS